MGLSAHAHNIVQEVEVHGWLSGIEELTKFSDFFFDSLETRLFVFLTERLVKLQYRTRVIGQEFHGPIINHTGRACPQFVMNIVMSHMNLSYHSVECYTIIIFMTRCGRVVNYRSMKFLDQLHEFYIARRSVSKRTAWSRGYFFDSCLLMIIGRISQIRAGGGWSSRYCVYAISRVRGHFHNYLCSS